MLKFSALEDGYGSNCGASDTVARKGRRQRGNLSMNRWKVERFFSWLNNFRRLATRFERLCMMHLGFIQLDCIMSLLRNVLKCSLANEHLRDSLRGWQHVAL